MPYASPALELMSEAAAQKERPEQNWRKKRCLKRTKEDFREAMRALRDAVQAIARRYTLPPNWLGLMRSQKEREVRFGRRLRRGWVPGYESIKEPE